MLYQVQTLWKGKEMTDLTDKWKKGELPEGYYYIKTDGKTNIDEYVQWYKDNEIPSEKSFVNFNVQQVIAPVPSYEEWKKAYECVVSENEEITTLKGLLKECKYELRGRYTDVGWEDWSLIDKINQALGEDK